MGVSMYAASLNEPHEFIECGKTAGFEGTEQRLLDFIAAKQQVVIFREDSVPVKKWAHADGFFDTASMPRWSHEVRDAS